MSGYISPLAKIDLGTLAGLPASVYIADFAELGSGVRLGEHVFIGRECRVYPRIALLEPWTRISLKSAIIDPWQVSVHQITDASGQLVDTLTMCALPFNGKLTSTDWFVSIESTMFPATGLPASGFSTIEDFKINLADAVADQHLPESVLDKYNVAINRALVDLRQWASDTDPLIQLS